MTGKSIGRLLTSAEVHCHCQEQIPDAAEDSNGEKYDKFIKANREATKECIPKRTRAKKTLISSDDRVKEARQDAQQALNQFEASNSENDKVVWTQARTAN